MSTSMSTSTKTCTRVRVRVPKLVLEYEYECECEYEYYKSAVLAVERYLVEIGMPENIYIDTKIFKIGQSYEVDI